MRRSWYEVTPLGRLGTPARCRPVHPLPVVRRIELRDGVAAGYRRWQIDPVTYSLPLGRITHRVTNTLLCEVVIRRTFRKSIRARAVPGSGVSVLAAGIRLRRTAGRRSRRVSERPAHLCERDVGFFSPRGTHRHPGKEPDAHAGAERQPAGGPPGNADRGDLGARRGRNLRPHHRTGVGRERPDCLTRSSCFRILVS